MKPIESINAKTKVVLLGTGTPNAEPERSGSSVAVVASGEAYLFDFGPGVVRRANATYQMGVEALLPSKLRTAFLTHLHADHTAGYADLILTPWTLEREAPLRVFGPPGILAMTDHLLAAYAEDIRERVEGLQPSNQSGHIVDVHEIEPGVCYEDEHLSVEAFHAVHGNWTAYSFRITTQDGTIVISGDTAPHDLMDEKYACCDLLVHEVYSSSGYEKLPKAWQRYHAAVHTSSWELGQIAERVQPAQLVLYHQLLWGRPEESLIDEIQAFFSGRVFSGKDLDIFKVSKNKNQT
jgi:ribonuclease BN (tRNA processing enzyme)